MSRIEYFRVFQQRCAFTTLRHVTGLGALALLLNGCSASQHISQGEPAVESNPLHDPQPFERLAPVTYTPEAWPQALKATVYLPNGSTDTRRPAALVVHGGGWRNRTPQDMQGIAEQLAGQGYVAVNVEYRFAPEYRFPNQLHDLQQAMSWIHANADEWQVDTDRIVGVGFSSGAHLVSLLALAGEEGPLAEPYGGEQSRLAAVLAGGLPSDLLKFEDGPLVVDFIGGTRAEETETYRLASPAWQITSQAPPFFLFHGKWDKLVPVDHATDFYQALQDNNIESELYLQRWRGHITSFLLRGGAIDAGIAFLNRQVNP